jgi:hypothetical protein
LFAAPGHRGRERGDGVTSLWEGSALVGDLATGGSGGLNAAYFAGRAGGAAGPRRLAAAVLALLCGGVALAATRDALGTPDGPAGLLLRAPLLVANLAVTWLAWNGGRR